MFCGKCGNELPDDAVFCNNCGAPLRENSVANEYRQEIPEEFYYSEQKSGKKSSLKWIVIIAMLLILGVGVFAIVKLMNGPKHEESGVKGNTILSKDESDEEEEFWEEETPEEKNTFSTMDVVGRPADLAKYHVLSPENVYATSVVEQEGYDNGPSVMFDGDAATSWQEGAPGSGIGEGVEIRLRNDYNIKYIAFKLGNWRSEEHYWGNHRPAVLKIEIGDSVSELVFEDKRDVQWVELSSEVTAAEISIEIRDVYYGENTSWDEACIAEIEIYGK